MKRTYHILALSAALCLLLSSCKKDRGEEHEHDHEAIIRVELHFTKAGSSATEVFTWTDIDGDGGNAPVIETIELEENTTYQVAMELYDSDGHDLTHDIEDHESEHHRFYYSGHEAMGISINGLDKDINNTTLGLKSNWISTGQNNGKVKIILRHYQQANKEESDPVTSGKSATDAEIEFPVQVN